MKYFDLHCDTIYFLIEGQQHLQENDLHVSLRAGEGLKPWCQTFAIYIPEECKGSVAWKFYQDALACFKQELQKNSKRIALCFNGAQIYETLEAGLCAALLSVENASALGGDCTKLETMHQDGVRSITLTWNGVNEVGCGMLSGETSGLTPFGKNLIREMNRLGMAADVSHLNRVGFWDVFDSGVSMIASHSNAASVWEHPRSLTDDQIKGLIERKGLMGICFANGFLGEGEDTGRDAVLRQVRHVLELGGEKILAIGSDFDGTLVHSELNGVRCIELLYQYLSDHGIDKQALDDMFFNNAYDFYQRL